MSVTDSFGLVCLEPVDSAYLGFWYGGSRVVLAECYIITSAIDIKKEKLYDKLDDNQ